MSVFDRIKQWFGGGAQQGEAVAEGREPATMAPSDYGDTDRETSTNAQTQGSADEPWPGR